MYQNYPCTTFGTYSQCNMGFGPIALAIAATLYLSSQLHVYLKNSLLPNAQIASYLYPGYVSKPSNVSKHCKMSIVKSFFIDKEPLMYYKLLMS